MSAPTPPTNTDFLRRLVADRDVPCPACAANLRNLSADRCPHCHIPLAVRVGLVEPAWATFLSALVGLSIGLGFCGLLLILVAISTLFSRMGPPLRDLVPLFLGVLTAAPAMLLLILRRPRFIALDRAHRRLIAVIAWCVGLGFPILFLALVE